MKKKILLIMMLIGVFTFVGCNKDAKNTDTTDKADAKKETELEHVIVSEIRGESWMPVYIAESLGYFEDEGLDVEFVIYKDGPIAFQGMHAGDSQFCMLSTEPVLRAYEEGLKSKIIIPTVKNKQYMFATAEGISSVADLKGKAIFGGMPGSAPYSFVLSLLEKSGLDKNDVEWINMEYGAALTALDSGNISGAYFDSIYRKDLEKINANILIDTSNPEEHKELYGTEFYESQMVTVTEDYAKENPETVQKFVNAVVKGIEWQNNHSNEEIVELVDPMFEGKDLKDTIDVLKLSLTTDGKYSEEGYKAIEDFCLEQGLIKERIGYENIIDMEYVDKAWENIKK